MKRLFYLLIGLVLLPALLYAQGTLSLKDINDNLTNNYYTKTVSDSKYGTTASVALKADKTYVDSNFATTAENALKQNIADMVDYYTKTAADLLLADKADTDSVYTKTAADILLGLKAGLTYVNATDEAILLDNDSQDVQIEANRVAITLKATQIDMDSAEAAIELIHITDDSQDVAINAHLIDATGAHAATAISATSWDNVQNCLDSLETAIQSIVVGSGFALESWVNSTLETNFYTQAQTNATIEAAIAAIPAPSVNSTITVPAGEALTAGQVVSLINESGTVRAYNNPLTVSTSPNGAESVFNSATTTRITAVALDTTKFLAFFQESNKYYAIVGTVSGSSISWGTKSAYMENITSDSDGSCAKIGTDKVLAVYQDAAGKGRMVVLSISGTSVTVNTPADFQSTEPAVISVTQLDTDKALVCYRRATNTYGYAKIVTVSGTTPTPYPDAASDGTAFNAAATSYISVSALSSTSAIVAFSDGGDSNKGHAQVLSVSGTTITPGTEYTFKDATTTWCAVAKFDTDKAFIIYEDDGASSEGYGIVASNSGGTLSFGTAVQFDTGASGRGCVSTISTSKVLIAYRKSTDADFKSIIANISGTTITYNSIYSINTGMAVSTSSSCYLGNQKTVLVCPREADSYGSAYINTWATSSYASVAGISQGAYSSGSDAVVLIHGTDDNQSGLIAGEEYYVQTDFTLQTTETALDGNYIKMGIAKDSDSLILE